MGADVQAWLLGRLPDDWFVEPPQIEADRDEIVVTGRLAEPEVEGDAEARRAACRGRIRRFREETRGRRMAIAREAEAAFGRKLSWAARCGDEHERFTHLSLPVMTRLRMPERKVLDTLVDAGVARSRSEALAWCVALVGRHEADWLADLRSALEQVAEARRRGPAAG